MMRPALGGFLVWAGWIFTMPLLVLVSPWWAPLIVFCVLASVVLLFTDE
jgi:hypothetical protein